MELRLCISLTVGINNNNTGVAWTPASSSMSCDFSTSLWNPCCKVIQRRVSTAHPITATNTTQSRWVPGVSKQGEHRSRAACCLPSWNEEVVDQPPPAFLQVPAQNCPSSPWHCCRDPHYSIKFLEDFAIGQIASSQALFLASLANCSSYSDKVCTFFPGLGHLAK